LPASISAIAQAYEKEPSMKIVLLIKPANLRPGAISSG